jgi:hypothetical protein
MDDRTRTRAAPHRGPASTSFMVFDPGVQQVLLKTSSDPLKAI